MVLFFTSNAVNPPAIIYMGKDKEENEDLIRYGWPQDVWFHVDKLSSAHVYLRLPHTIESWEKIPQELLVDCAQLVKANSIEGNKKDNITIIYTPWDNLKKTGDMAVGQVSFHQNNRASSPLTLHPKWSSGLIRVVHVPERVNAIVNRINKTKVVREVDHEQEKVDRIKAESAKRKAAALEKKKADAELAKQREADKAARSYDNLFTDTHYEDEEDEDGEPKGRKTGTQLEEDFM
ncbi:Coiled-coil domain-containing protein 25 OS=Danio rerio GN=ccdc25 PE=1 SV=1 [Rhizoctonia solani AG-1 IB]|uniref:Coiled-coil domain-containing protein 25 n=1 Tax=Thanatephorus cucumeris (strain AG1-IB / isolate 7/3/14) TaxID=1108050 RepID=A0A0B7FGZ2_THACB|nr:Coiled-coil domain-containing protein 25 OS=Danio rerio GN=ccdc25 PE=1 SV=1 [Rhizoctonia solani AG-1 IB]